MLRVFENKVLRRIFGPKRDDVTVEWRRLHKKKLYAVYFSPNIIRVIKSRRLRWAGNVACMGERKSAYRALVGKLREGDHLKDPGINGRIILKWIIESWYRCINWIDLSQDNDSWRAVVNAVMNLRGKS